MVTCCLGSWRGAGGVVGGSVHLGIKERKTETLFMPTNYILVITSLGIRRSI